MRLTLLPAALVATVLSTSVSAQSWTPYMGAEDFEIKQGARFASGARDRDFTYDALRFDRTGYAYELVHMSDLLRASYPEITLDNIVFDRQTETTRVVRPSMAEAWKHYAADEAVIALVPFGFSEIAGEPRIAGFRKSAGVVENGVFSAPNLDTILCLDDVDAHAKRAERGLSEYPGQIPFLFPVVFTERVTYKYLEGLETVDLGLGANPDRFAETFAACPEMIQVGYRVVAPRDMDIDPDSEGRISHGPGSLRKLKPFERVVMSYDLSGRLNLVRSREPSSVHDFGRLLSSGGFYDNEKCEYSDRRKRSLSCEVWGVTVSAYDGAAIYLRQPDSAEPLIWGDGDRTAPAVLVIRARNAAPVETPEPQAALPQVDEDIAPQD